MCVTNTVCGQPLSLNTMEKVAAPVLITDSRPFRPNNLPKRRTKRLRKPQKPGLTAKNQERHFVVHNYHDHVNDPVSSEMSLSLTEKVHFPLKLHRVLDEVQKEGFGNILSWMPHGRCFVIHEPKAFVSTIMPKYFRQSKLTSFQRQLNLYGFQRITRGRDAGGYYNEYFLRGKPLLSNHMTRVKVKGTRYKAASNPEQEPDFYSMPYISSVPQVPHEKPILNVPVPVPCVSSSLHSSPYRGYGQQVTLMTDPIDMFESSTVQPYPLNSPEAAWDQKHSEPLDVVSSDDELELEPVMAEFCAEWGGLQEEDLEDDEQLRCILEDFLED